MFKKKSNLPARPKYPETNFIVDDLTSIPKDDPLFKTAKMISDKKFKSDSNSGQDVIYQKIKKLFNLHEDLQNVMNNLNAVGEDLKLKESEITKLSNDLKEEAAKAFV